MKATLECCMDQLKNRTSENVCNVIKELGNLLISSAEIMLPSRLKNKTINYEYRGSNYNINYWFDGECKSMKQNLYRYLRQFRRDRSQYSLELYKKAKKQYAGTVRSKKFQFKLKQTGALKML